VSNARFGAMVEGDVAQKLHSAVVRQGVRIALGGRIDPSFAGGMLTLEVELVSIRTGRLIGDGPMIHTNSRSRREGRCSVHQREKYPSSPCYAT
jgi:hypothetical protein